MALDDIYVIEDHQTYNGVEPLLNVYTYQRTDAAGSAVGLAAAFIQDVMLEIEAVQTTLVAHTLVRVYSLGDLTDFAETTLTDHLGNINSPTLPSFNAVNYTLRAASRAVRPGSKRYAGIPEADVTNDTITAPAYIALLEALRVQLSDVIESPGDSSTYFPVVVKRVPYVTPKGNDAYRWPQPGDTLVAPAITGALLNLKISHQVSRGNSR